MNGTNAGVVLVVLAVLAGLGAVAGTAWGMTATTMGVTA
jgi:hypothetical protein